MSLPIASLAQLGAQGLTLLALHAGSPTPAVVAARASAANEVATIIAAIGKGDATGALSALETLTTSADAGVQAFITDIYGQAQSWLTVQMQINSAVPLIGAAAQQIATDVAAGMVAAAAPYLSVGK